MYFVALRLLLSDQAATDPVSALYLVHILKLQIPHDIEVIMRLIIRILTPLVLLLSMLSFAGGATAAPAIVTPHTETFAAVVNECNGGFDHVGLSGTMTFVENQLPNGSSVVHVTIKAQGVSSDGNEYQLIWTGKAKQDTSFEDRVMLVSKGSLPNQTVIVRYDPDTGFSSEAVCTG
ncbi:hypothetical protein M1D93_13125 [Arthrobacter sp. Z1-9]